MWTLALETASSHGSLALLRDTETVQATGLEARQIAGTLLSTMQSLLAAQQLDLGDIGLLAVGDGPGSFTGVRIGLATVKAIMESRGIPAVAVSTLAAVAACTPVEAGTPVMAVLEAGRGEVYAGVYARGAMESTGGEAIVLAAEFVARLEDWSGETATPDEELARQWPRLRLVEPHLAAALGRLAQGGDARRAHVLTLDARYLGARWK